MFCPVVRRWSRLLAVTASCVLVCLAVGCAGTRWLDKLPMYTARRLPPILGAPDAIYLDVVFAERPRHDSLLGPELWQHIDQTADLNAKTRDSLRDNGLRVGVVGSQPPPALSTVLGLNMDFVDPKHENSKKLMGHQSIIRSGGFTEIQSNPTAYEDCHFDVVRSEQGTVVETTHKKFAGARCIYKVTAERVQDGWVRLDFTPQVMHGAPRPVYSMEIDEQESHPDYVYAQKTESFPQQQFSVTLSVGEMAVISATEDAKGRLGEVFFQGTNDENVEVQRVLVIRLANMGLTDDPYGNN